MLIILPPSHQVCPPRLHLTLGIFYRLWCLLETGCHHLDIELARRTAPLPTDRDSFLQYSSLVKELTKMSEVRDELVHLLSALNSRLGDIALQCTCDVNPIVEALKEEARTTMLKLEKVVQIAYTQTIHV